MSPLKVAIIGAGLGGLATALALRKQGIDAQIYEKAQNLLPVGAGLTLLPNGLKSLDAITPGIVESLKEAGSQAHRVNLKKSIGETIAQNNLSLQDNYGQPMLNIRWSRLQEMLVSYLPLDIIHLNHRCVNFEYLEDGVKIYFENDTTVKADLLIGADGINSVVRQVIVGDGSPRYAGRMSWRAVVEYGNEQLLDNESTFILGSNGKNFSFIDVGSGYIFWSAAALLLDESTSPSPTEVKSRVLEVFADWTEPVQSIVQTTPAIKIVERPIYDRPPLENWSKGRVTLLGDAAHPVVPVLGQGANMAFEDAWELGLYLQRSPNIEEALANYENSRIKRTQIIQARSAFQGSRSYDTDSDQFLGGIMEQAKMSQAEFDDWVYNYEPSMM
ncbi:MAG: FAD-dependent monooxygenase [Scytonematopsis contorta HA4267-MV1]|jgi:salicylate hydroxylase|nr:FAD-dependent monooxygenase [Scytonematopsis contorta HA4267-MV1]